MKNIQGANIAGGNPSRGRVDNDYYATPEEGTIPLFENEQFQGEIWECACGQGHMAEVFKENYYDVYSTDLVDRGYGETRNFLKCCLPINRDIFTNPPFKLAEEFVKAMEE